MIETFDVREPNNGRPVVLIWHRGTWFSSNFRSVTEAVRFGYRAKVQRVHTLAEVNR